MVNHHLVQGARDRKKIWLLVRCESGVQQAVEEFHDLAEAERALAATTPGSTQAPPRSLADLPYRALLDDFATASAAPGGGSAAALAAATAAALVERCAAAAAASAGFAEAGQRSRTLRRILTAVANDDVDVVNALAAAGRSAGASDRQTIDHALADASRPPAMLRDAAAEVAALARALEASGHPRLRAEAHCAVLLADAAVVAAESIIAANASS
jgi:formiminotetrahydrofolate cyclodeaminase